MRVLLLDRSGIFAHRLSAILAGFSVVDVVPASSFEDLPPDTGNDDVALLVLSSNGGGLKDFAHLYAMRPDCPIVVVTTTSDEALGLKAVRDGASDHLLVEQLSPTLVVRSLQYACERRNTRAALQQSEARFREFFERSREGLFATTADGTITEANRAALEMFGYTREELIGTSVARLYANPGERDRLVGHLDQFGHCDNFALEGLHKSGAVLSVIVSLALSTDADGQVTGIEGAIKDVTEQVRGQNALRASEERFRLIAENIREVYFVADGDFSRFTYVSPAYEDLWGESPEALYANPESFITNVPEEDRPLVAAAMAGAASGMPQQVEYRVVRATDNEVRWVHSRTFPVRNEHGEVYSIVGTTEDITDRKLAEQEVRASSEELKAILQLSALPIAVLNEDLQVELWNKSAERVFGWTAEEVIGRQYPVLDGSGAIPTVNLLAALSGTPLEGREVVRRTRDGAQIELRIWSTVLPESSDGKRRVVGIFEPVTEQKQLEAQLRHAQKMEAVGQLAGGIAHDFNNILTAINGQSELMIEQLPTGHPMRADVLEILRAGERAADLTRQLLAFSRKQIIKIQPIEVSELAGGMVKLLQRMIGPDIALTMNPAASPAWIEADRGQIEQVIMNLSVNARDAMPDGGELCITVENGSSDRRIKRSGWRKDEGVRIIVRDTGCGMDSETRSRIFEPFFTTKDPGKGTGLGLATVYGIVTHAGGDISVESHPGKGTTFVIELPTIPQPSVLPGAEHETKLQSRGSETILVVDDEPAVRAVAVRSLRRHGYNVLEAANGEAALKLAHEHPGSIDVLLTDMVMPKQGGREVADRVIQGRPHTRIIFMSGYTEDEALRRGVLARDETFVEKPFSPSVLVRRVREALDRNLR